MGMLHGIKRALLRRRKKYYQKVKGTNPFAYWPMWESSGIVSQDLVLAAQNGAYTGVTLGQPGIGDGRTAPFFDEVNDFNNAYTPTLAGRFNGSEGTMAAWAKVANAGVWADGTSNVIATIVVDASNWFLVYKHPNPSTLQGYYEAGGVFEFVNLNPVSTLDWFHVAITWSVTADEFRFYFGGIQVGMTQAGLGAWAGNITGAVIGASDIVPVNTWHGYLAHAALWTRPLTPAQIASLAVV